MALISLESQTKKHLNYFLKVLDMYLNHYGKKKFVMSINQLKKKNLPKQNPIKCQRHRNDTKKNLNDKVYNSVILFDKDGVKSIYNKQRPVPLAEQVPMSETFPFLKSINLGVANYSSGKKAHKKAPQINIVIAKKLQQNR